MIFAIVLALLLIMLSFVTMIDRIGAPERQIAARERRADFLNRS